MTHVAINGFGRTGRLALRPAWPREDDECAHADRMVELAAAIAAGPRG